MANLPPNSFLKPVEPVPASPYQRIDPKALGGLQPLVSDLIQTNASKNKFLKETYSADPQALQNRLNEYKFYDPVQLEGLKDYFSPYAAASYKNSLVFKPSEFQAAQSKLFGLDASQTQALSGALQAYKPIGTLGGSNYYSKDDIGKALSGYGAIDTGKWGGYSDSVRSKFSPVTTIGNQVLIRPEDTGTLRTVLGVEDYLGKINPLRTKQEVWTPDPALVAERKWWDSTPLRPDPSLGYREIQGGVDENGVASASIWVRDVADPLSYDQFWSEYGTAPEGGWRDSNIKRSFNLLHRTKPPLQRWQDDASYLPNFSLYGSGSPEDIQRGFNVLQRMSPQNIGEFWSLSPAAQKGMLENPGVALQQMQSLANPANGDWLSIGAEGGFRDINAYNWDAARGLTADRSQYMTIDDSNSGLLGSLNEVIQKVDPLNSVVEKGVANLLGYDSGLDMVRSIGEPIGNLAGAAFSGGVPWGSIVMGLDNISTGNDKALLGNVVGGLTSYAGTKMPTGSVLGTGYSLGSAATNTAANQAVINALSTAARGGDTSNILTSALISGLGAYGSGALGDAMKGASPLAKMAANTGYGTAVGGLSSALQGKGFSQGATNAARRGVTNAAINAALNSQLYKGLV